MEDALMIIICIGVVLSVIALVVFQTAREKKSAVEIEIAGELLESHLKAHLKQIENEQTKEEQK